MLYDEALVHASNVIFFAFYEVLEKVDIVELLEQLVAFFFQEVQYLNEPNINVISYKDIKKFYELINFINYLDILVVD